MKARRLFGSVLATVLASTSLVVVATASNPAAAVDPVQTRIVAGSTTRPVFSSTARPLAYGSRIDVSINVEALVNGVWKQIYYGPVSVTRQVVGSKSASE